MGEKNRATGRNNSRQQRNRSNNKNRRPKKYGGPSPEAIYTRNEAFIEEAKTRAEERFEVEPRKMGFPEDLEEAKSFSFEWVTNPVPLRDEEAASKIVIQRGEFGWLSEQRVDEIGDQIQDLKINLDQSLSLRSALLQQKTVYSHHRMRSKGKQLRRLYEEGVSVVDLSRKFDFPPMNIFRTILSEKGWSKARIKTHFKEPSKFKKREREEFEKAEAADRVSNVDQSETHEKADLFEEVLADWFEQKGVRLRRQPEMVAEQNQEHGRPIRTPDLLFLDHVEINGEPIAWIDAKHYYGADVEFQRKKMVKQMTRYIDEWGSGAVVYRHGFSENMYIPGCILLDAEQLDLTRLEANPQS
ncbi:MAG: hypothetical protein CMB73_06445 [Euryarchaeota archaeon]|nr:hypothetical protein [Euryarchaeota archaeon]|tara:strand:+ start:23233 stop:24303 length:1071 start_codon:yes stop_codon:yes gene_type:complete